MADPSSTAHAPLAACPNCGTSLESHDAPPRYCPQCGQHTVLHPPSVGEFAHEFIGHYIALEGSLWRSLRLLVLHPGRLTREYLAGRRQRYVLPLRLYLSASFVFFLVFKLVAESPQGLPLHVNVKGPSFAASAPASAASPGADDNGDVTIISPGGVHVASQAEARRIMRERLAQCAGDKPAADCGWMERTFSHASQRWMDDPDHAWGAFTAHALGLAPYVAFLMLPAFAAVLALAYRGRRMLFGEHFVAAMHLQAFGFLVSTLAVTLPGDIASLAQVVLGVYLVMALRAVYGGAWGWTIARSFFVATLYGVSLGIVSLAVAIWLFVG